MNTKLNFKQTFTAGATAAGAATIANVILFYLFQAIGLITDDIYIQPNQPMTVVPIIISSIVPTLLATLVFFLLEKYTANGFKLFRIISIVLLLASFLNPFFGISGVTVGYAIALNVMHVTVVGALLYFIGNAVKKNSTI